MEDLAAVVGRRLREAREAVGLSQYGVAAHLGLGHVGYGDMERGRVLVRLDHLIAVAQLFGRPVSWFVGEVPGGLADLDDLSRELVGLVVGLPERERRAVLSYARFVAVETAKRVAEEGQQ
jgi:transcriptional regulator with XRE-family HTH domain